MRGEVPPTLFWIAAAVVLGAVIAWQLFLLLVLVLVPLVVAS